MKTYWIRYSSVAVAKTASAANSAERGAQHATRNMTETGPPPGGAFVVRLPIQFFYSQPRTKGA